MARKRVLPSTHLRTESSHSLERRTALAMRSSA